MFRVLVACTVFCMYSCTVLEERSGCPCYLAVDLSKVDKSIREWQLWLFAGEQHYKRKRECKCFFHNATFQYGFPTRIPTLF